MNRKEFMMQLEQLLKDIPQEERDEALAYYNGYFEDAGEENEEKIIKELETPQKVANIIMEDAGADETREYTENGYKDQRFARQQEVGSRKTSQEHSRQEDAAFKKPEQSSSSDNTLKVVLLVIVAVLTSPIWLGLLGGAIGLFGGLIGVIIALLAVVFALYVCGVVFSGIGIVMVCSGVFGIGLGLTGSGLLILALAILGTVGCAWFIGKFLPWLIKGFVNLCSRAFQNRGKVL